MLYIDFDNDMRESYHSLFTRYFKEVYVTKDDAYEIYREKKPDIIVIELLVPESLKLIKKIREKDNKVVFMALTTESSIAMLREIVELSFSSYLIKPISDRYMEKELHKILKKIENRGKVYLPFFCQWDIKSQTLIHEERVVFLTKRESKLFQLLVEKRGKFCSDDDILFFIWGDEFEKSITNSSIRTLIKNLRKKVPSGLIENQYGVGYKITV